jgi:MinD superfamily P-loop ATPase
MDFPKVKPEKCTGCGTCVESCSMQAIKLINDIAVIDTTICGSCWICVSDCPMEAIS